MNKRYLCVLYTLFLVGIGIGKAQYTDIYDFNNAVPTGSLTLLGNKFYGTANSGYGSIYSIDTNGKNYTDLFDFNGTNGAIPTGLLTLSVTGDTLFGMTFEGGTNYNTFRHIKGYGCVFSIKTDGTGYHRLMEFNNTNGASPYGGLTVLGNILYGMTYFGGLHNKGLVFSIHSDGTGYKDMLDFDSINGANPQGSLTLSVTGDTLFGMTQRGGVANNGCVFSILSDGTDYHKLMDFTIPNSNGGNPTGDLTLSKCKLYGMADGTGMNQGCVFLINTDGTGYKDLFKFSETNGGFPVGSLTILDGVLYGTTTQGGITPSSAGSGSGIVFSINTDGTSFKNLYDFNALGNHNHLLGKSAIIINGLFYGIEGNWSKTNTNADIFNYKL